MHGKIDSAAMPGQGADGDIVHPEVVEAGLLLEEVLGSRLGGLELQGKVHAPRGGRFVRDGRDGCAISSGMIEAAAIFCLSREG